MRLTNDAGNVSDVIPIDLAKHVEYKPEITGSVYHVKKMMLANDSERLAKIGVKLVNIESDGSLSVYFEKIEQEQDKATKEEITKIVNKYATK
jgi:hypothetical protein